MKTLNIAELELLQGSNRGKEILDAACIGYGAGALLVKAAKVALGPVGGAIGAGCVVYGVGRYLDWW